MGQFKTNLTINTLQPLPSSPAPSSPATSPASHQLSPLHQQQYQYYSHQQHQRQPSAAPSSIIAGSDVPGQQPPTPLHLAIHLIMGDQQYIATSLQHPDGLSGTPSLPEAAQSAAAPPTTFSSVLTPYSAVSSFNYPAQCDPSLLTPISSAGSPPLHQGQKLGRQYPPPPGTPHQEHTPPDTTKMYNQWSQFDMQGQTSQTSSPMANPAAVAPDFNMHGGYMHEDRRTPAPPEPYLGNYGVSNGPEQSSMAENPYYVPMPSMENANGLLLREPHGLAADGRQIPSAPLLNQPHPSHFRQGRRGSAEDPLFHHHHPDASRSMSGSPRRRAAAQSNTRVKKRSSRRASASQKSSSPKDPADEHKNCHGVEAMPRLKPSCNEIDRLVVESRWRFRTSRGQDMWSLIQKDIKAQTGKDFGREDLQMKFRRARLHIQWETRDEEILQEAWYKMEAERYHTLREKFLELGGSRNMCANAVDIESKIVTLGFEENMYMQNQQIPIRRRRRVSTKKRNNNSQTQSQDDMVPTKNEEWAEMAPTANMTPEEIAQQVYAARPEAWGADEDMMDMHMATARIKIEPGQ